MNTRKITMKAVTGLAIILNILLPPSAHSEAMDLSKLRRFHDLQGRTFRGFIEAFDAKKAEVSIRRLDGKKGTLKLSTFSEEDRTYIQNWGMANAFINGIKITHKAVYDKTTIKAGESGIDKKSWEASYEVTLTNTTAYSYEKLAIEYCVYYRQGLRKDEETVYSQGVCAGDFSVDKIKASTQTNLTTQTVELFSEEGQKSVFGSVSKSSSDVEGIWLRISAQLPTGEKRTFEYKSRENADWQWSDLSVKPSSAPHKDRKAPRELPPL